MSHLRPRSSARVIAQRLLAPLWLGALMLLLLLAMLAWPAQARSRDDLVLERSVKVASIYKFLSYVEWPPALMPASDEPLVIGVAGSDDAADELSRIVVGRTSHNRALAVKRVRPGDSLKDMHVLFVTQGATDSAVLLRQAQQRSILSITESDSSLPPGSVINFKLVDGRVRFEVSLAAAEKCNLRISARMLPIAVQVYPGGQP